MNGVIPNALNAPKPIPAATTYGVTSCKNLNEYFKPLRALTF